MTTIQQVPAYPAVTDQAPVVTQYITPAAVPLMGPEDPGTATPLMGAAATGSSIPLMGTAAPGYAVPLMGSATAGAPIPLMGPADSSETALMRPAR